MSLLKKLDAAKKSATRSIATLAAIISPYISQGQIVKLNEPIETSWTKTVPTEVKQVNRATMGEYAAEPRPTYFTGEVDQENMRITFQYFTEKPSDTRSNLQLDLDRNHSAVYVLVPKGVNVTSEKQELIDIDNEGAEYTPIPEKQNTITARAMNYTGKRILEFADSAEVPLVGLSLVDLTTWVKSEERLEENKDKIVAQTGYNAYKIPLKAVDRGLFDSAEEGRRFQVQLSTDNLKGKNFEGKEIPVIVYYRIWRQNIGTGSESYQSKLEAIAETELENKDFGRKGLLKEAMGSWLVTFTEDESQRDYMLFTLQKKADNYQLTMKNSRGEDGAPIIVTPESNRYILGSDTEKGSIVLQKIGADQTEDMEELLRQLSRAKKIIRENAHKVPLTGRTDGGAEALINQAVIEVRLLHKRITEEANK